MKSAGLSSTSRKTFKQTTRMTAFSAHQDKHFAAKERQRLLQVQVRQAQIAMQQKQERETASSAHEQAESQDAE